jgi:hypothetical protein
MPYEEGVYDNIPAWEYHADCCPEPSLSHSILRVLLERSPLHARTAHPRLNPDHTPAKPTDAMVSGSILHHLVLGKGERLHVIQADSYRTNAAKEARDAAIAAGATPVLQDDFAELQTAASAIRSQLREIPEAASFFAPGVSEAVAICRVGPIWCRSMIDRLPNAEGAPLWDLKTTGDSANPADWERALSRKHLTQAAFYRLTTSLALGRPVGEMRFIVAEQKPPFAVSIVACGDSMVEAAEAEVRRAMELWARCMVMDDWPGYGRGVHRIEAPVHMLARAEAAKLDFGRIAA